MIRAVDDVTFSLATGDTLGLVGESGSGKSTAALAIMRLIEAPGIIASGTIEFQGRDVLKMRDAELCAMRGGDLAMVFQDPMTSLNPVLSIARQLSEAMVVHGRPVAEAKRRSVSLLGRMGLTAPERAIDSYPHQFSGGMRQRVVIAMGMSNEPVLLLADEPTTALDVTIQAQILDLLRELNRDFGTAIMLVSHNLGVVASLCTRVAVMYAGEIVEEGLTEEVLKEPRHPYTWALMNAIPRLDAPLADGRRLRTIEGTPPHPLAFPTGCRFAPRCPFRREICTAEHPDLQAVAPGHLSRCWVAAEGQVFHPEKATHVSATSAPPETSTPRLPPLVTVHGLVKHFRLSHRMFEQARAVHAVDGLDFDIAGGETLGVVGESGCGKSTLGRLLLRIHKPDAGQICFDGHQIARASSAVIRPLRRRMQMIFQDPYASLNPRMTVGQILTEPLRYYDLAKGSKEAQDRVEALLDLVGLPSGAAQRYPHEFSGGQRQRVSIARALALKPDFIVADEPVSSLDVNIQAQIINLMMDLQERLHLTYMFIAHDLAVVRHISDRVMVLHLGQAAEIAEAAALFAEPLHPYTRYLISAILVPDVGVERAHQRQILSGEPGSAIDPPSGCRFRTRCPLAQAICSEVVPPLVAARPGHFVACHFPGAP
ncbi:MAG: dipeptide ABC transporter ATP-binding protein [Acetobacteraceae bacterium]